LIDLFIYLFIYLFICVHEIYSWHLVGPLDIEQVGGLINRNIQS